MTVLLSTVFLLCAVFTIANFMTTEVNTKESFFYAFSSVILIILGLVIF